jgi:hypothetical protein
MAVSTAARLVVPIAPDDTAPDRPLSEDDQRLVAAWLRRLEREAPAPSLDLTVPRYLARRIAATFTPAESTT